MLLLLLGLVISVRPANANSVYQSLPFSQNWSNTGLITVNDDWSGVPGVQGYLGDIFTSTSPTNLDPQTILTPATTIDVIANQTAPNTLTSGGVAEFEITNPVAALQGSGTADAPSLVFYVNTTGWQDVTISYNLRDIDGAADNAVQQVALQYRVGATGDFINVPEGYVVDATTGPSLADLVTPITVTLPAAVNNQSQVEIRVITTNAIGSDEWVGVDDVVITGTPEVDLALDKTGPTSALPGDTVTYTLTLANSGVLTATATVLTDTLPAELDFITYTTSLSHSFSQIGSDLVWALGDVASQTTGLTIQVQASVPASATTGVTLTNIATATTTAIEPVTTNNIDQVGTFISKPTVYFTLLHTNDFHGNLEPSGSYPGLARVAYAVNQVRTEVGPENTLLFDAGDIMQGTLLSNLYYGESTIDVYNTMPYTVATLGNHEFDWSQTTLISRTQQANFPFLAANVVMSNTGSCDTAGWTVPTFIRPWITRTVGLTHQVTLGIIGVTNRETPYITKVENTAGLCFQDPAEAINHYYAEVDAASDVVIVLSHIGLDDPAVQVYDFPLYGDQTLARRLVEAGHPVPLIIGGHSHTNMFVPTIVSGTTIAQAYNNGRKVGRADLAVAPDGVITVTWRPITITTSLTEDAAIKARIATWSSDPDYQTLINQVVGYSNVDLTRNTNGDSLMGAFIEDAIYNDLNTDANPDNDTDIVFNNPGGLRADLTNAVKPFTLTYGLMFSVLPFGNQTVVGELTGAQIQELLRQSATLNKGVLQVAGIRYTFYNYNPGSGTVSGVISATVRNRSTGAWEPLDLNRTYRVATNDFLAPAGQDGFTAFRAIQNYTAYGDMLNGVNRWVSQTYPLAQPYTATLDGRIKRAVLAVTPPSMVGSEQPGRTVTYTLAITNIGPLTNTFILSGSGNIWPVSLPVSLTLSIGAMSEANVIVTIPVTATNSVSDTVTVVVASQSDPTQSVIVPLITTATTPNTWIYLPLIQKDGQ